MKEKKDYAKNEKNSEQLIHISFNDINLRKFKKLVKINENLRKSRKICENP